jgi:hypothetical protein
MTLKEVQLFQTVISPFNKLPRLYEFASLKAWFVISGFYRAVIRFWLY